MPTTRHSGISMGALSVPGLCSDAVGLGIWGNWMGITERGVRCPSALLQRGTKESSWVCTSAEKDVPPMLVSSCTNKSSRIKRIFWMGFLGKVCSQFADRDN
jgi:hypothetical protein